MYKKKEKVSAASNFSGFFFEKSKGIRRKSKKNLAKKLISANFEKATLRSLRRKRF